MRGSCLCGSIVFEFTQILGPFELCVCTRCQKVSGSAFKAMLTIASQGFRILQGQEFIHCYLAPVRDTAPAYAHYFCRQCGAAAPNPSPEGDCFEIPAGLLDEPCSVVPDKQIYVEYCASWYALDDRLPKYNRAGINALRQAKNTPT